MLQLCEAKVNNNSLCVCCMLYVFISVVCSACRVRYFLLRTVLLSVCLGVLNCCWSRIQLCGVSQALHTSCDLPGLHIFSIVLSVYN